MRPLLQPVTPSIEDPLELLKACHDKVRRFSALVPRLRDHLARHGPDAQAQEAARSILRYFEVAAPLDEASLRCISAAMMARRTQP